MVENQNNNQQNQNIPQNSSNQTYFDNTAQIAAQNQLPNQYPQTPNANMQVPNQQQYSQQAMHTQNNTDVFGIISIVLALAGLPMVGIVLAIVGLKKGKRVGYSTTLSKVGLILSIIFSIIILLIILLAVVGIKSSEIVQQRANDNASISNIQYVESVIGQEYSKTNQLPTNCSGVEALVKKDSANSGTTMMTCSDSDPSANSNTYKYDYNNGQPVFSYWSQEESTVKTVTF